MVIEDFVYFDDHIKEDGTEERIFEVSIKLNKNDTDYFHLSSHEDGFTIMLPGEVWRKLFEKYEEVIDAFYNGD